MAEFKGIEGNGDRCEDAQATAGGECYFIFYLVLWLRWHRAVFTNLVKPGILLPEDDPSTGSDSELSETVKPKKINIMSKMWKTVVRLTAHHQQQQQLKALDKRMQSSHHGSLPRSRNIWGFPTKYDLVPRISRDVDSQKPFPGRKASSCLKNNSISYRHRDNKASKATSKQLHDIDENKIFSTLKTHPQKTETIQVDVDVVEAETARIVGNNLVVRSHRMSRRVSVTSLPAEQQKAVCSSKKKQCFKIFKRIKRKNLEQNRRHSFLTVGKLQAQVDELVDTVSEKSMRLLAQRHAELQQCENLGDEILQSSKQFQRVSKRSAQKYKWKNCFLCGCCC
ncbi:putative uncharacterized protein C3orf49 [Callorhinchus milii]|uniref:putative uncharacterized protein C3orf49 n=1 Tax=Callorhinchus milii TaxID=7868 RepID=UPI001C3F4E99|nr:putative uncharacterized protein C3orf49 [Callorhinchus milii]